MKPVRVQLKRTKGWRMPPNTVNVARPGKWGNPFAVSVVGSAQLAVDLFRHTMTIGFDPSPLDHLSAQDFADVYAARQRWHKRLGWGLEHVAGARAELRGKNLACWCPLDAPCHADVLLELANTTPPLASGRAAVGEG
jgi:hypothetical protein